MRDKTGATIVAVVRDDKTEVAPDANFKLSADDTLVILGTPEKIESAMSLADKKTS